ncbi:MAG: hypothetical protein HY465_01360 [Deltaproteobacteria bacterium]|nr:hypothetical protein [Deltaproteobacteria bacterium]
MNIPFYPNTGDGTHCWQAALKMALKVFEPDRDYSYDELDTISAKLPGKWTWPTAAMLWLLKRGYDVRLIEESDYRALADRGEAYILEKCGEEVGRTQIAMSEMKQEVIFAREFAVTAPLEVRLPTIKDFQQFLKDGSIIICNINAACLAGQAGYSGHFVVVCEMGEKDVLLHDPGLPPRPWLTVTRKVFEAALGYPTKHEKNLLAIKLSAKVPQKAS